MSTKQCIPTIKIPINLDCTLIGTELATASEPALTAKSLASPDETALASPDETALASPDKTALANTDETAPTDPDEAAPNGPDETALATAPQAQVQYASEMGNVTDLLLSPTITTERVLLDYKDGDEIPEGLTFLQDHQESAATELAVPASVPCEDKTSWSAFGRGRYTCKWWAANDPGCKRYREYGQTTNCPGTCYSKLPASTKAYLAAKCNCNIKATLITRTTPEFKACINPSYIEMKLPFSVAVKIEAKCYKAFSYEKGFEKLVYSDPTKGKVEATFSFSQTVEAGLYGWIKPIFSGRITGHTSNGGSATINNPTYEKDVEFETKTKGSLTAAVVASMGPTFPVVGAITVGSIGGYAEASNAGTVTLSPSGISASYKANVKAYIQAKAGLSVSIGGSAGLCGRSIGFSTSFDPFGRKWTLISRSVGSEMLLADKDLHDIDGAKELLPPGNMTSGDVTLSQR